MNTGPHRPETLAQPGRPEITPAPPRPYVIGPAAGLVFDPWAEL